MAIASLQAHSGSAQRLEPRSTSDSSSSMRLWRMRWNASCSVTSILSMLRSARSIAARRLAFSLASDSALARKIDTNRYSRISARKVCVASPMVSGSMPVGQGIATQRWRHASSSGSSRWLTGAYPAPAVGRL